MYCTPHTVISLYLPKWSMRCGSLPHTVWVGTRESGKRLPVRVSRLVRKVCVGLPAMYGERGRVMWCLCLVATEEGSSIEEGDIACTSVPRGSESSSAVTIEL